MGADLKTRTRAARLGVDLDRASPRDSLIAWSTGIALMLFAFFLRVWRLGQPREFEFDETYYAKDAWSLLHHGYVPKVVDDANELILGGQATGIWKDEPSMVVHPEFGKWMIAAGEHFFGMTPFGWRIASAVAGSLMVLVMFRLLMRLTGSLMLGVFGALLLTFDGMHLVLSRLALLDIFLAFWLLCAVAALVADRDWTRRKMALASHDGAWGPLRGLWFRPWRLAAGICFGLAIATKWSAAYPLAAFGLMVWLWDAGARRRLGVRTAVLRSALVDAVPAFVHLVVVAGLVYVATWSGWLLHADKYEEHLSSTQYTGFVEEGPDCKHVSDDDARWPTATEPDASGLGELGQSLRSLWYYHQDLYTFHTHYLNCSEHTYQSDPRGWLLLNRPVGVNVENDIEPGDQGCEAAAGSTCLRQVLLLGTPVLWWGGALALAAAAVLWIGRRDWRYGLAVVGAITMWWPWELNDTRPIFSFYASAILPFLIIALTLVAGLLLGRGREPSSRRTLGTIVAGSFLVLVALNFAWFWPIYTNELLTRTEWLDRIWFKRWI
ncbi:dolichyl-phosphate-mannose--protein mannosyltransferase [Nocardioides alcanivorans]|uniref:dolichyl-phosphate-mannose--protein mannosyltransferase n=1 Tax=Nocardioides alcanivorans TaxID=2897352 RepID=UPI001F21C16F|nr:phospholipid carrier-dependent glycosyltransferase [Nocardioides alcanivorans]